MVKIASLSTESVQGAAGSLQSIDNVERRNSFAKWEGEISTRLMIEQGPEWQLTAWRARCK